MASASNTFSQDCYDSFFPKGIAEYKEGTYDKAIFMWQSALNNCMELTTAQRQTLNGWIKKAWVAS